MSSSVCGLSSTASIFGGLCSNRRPSMFTAKYRLREERKKVLKMSLAKVKRIEDPESFLRRSVLINNTIKRLQREVREEKMMRHGGYSPRLSSCSSYRKSFACSRLTDLTVVDEPVLDEPEILEPEGPSPLDSITIDKSHHNSPSIMHNPRKRPLSEESEDDCDVQAVLSEIFPPTPCIISSIDDDDNAMHAGVSSSTARDGVRENSSSDNCTQNNPCDSSTSVLDAVSFANVVSGNAASSSSPLDCPLTNMSSMLISSSYTSSAAAVASMSLSSAHITSSSSSIDYQGPESKRARLSRDAECSDDDDPTTSLLSAVNDECSLDEDDVDVDVVGDSEMSDWPTPPSTPTSLSLLTSAAAHAVAVASSASSPINSLAASLALSYSISAHCASLAGSSMVHHHPGMSMSPISAAAAAAAAAMQATSSCLLNATSLTSSNSLGHTELDDDEDDGDMEEEDEHELEVGSTHDEDSNQGPPSLSMGDNDNGATTSGIEKDYNSNSSTSSGSSNTDDSSDIDFSSVVSSVNSPTPTWGDLNNHSLHHAFSITSSPAFPIFSSSFANANPTVLSPSTLGNGLMMSPLPMTNPCSIPSFVTPSLSLPTSSEDLEDEEYDDEEVTTNQNHSTEDSFQTKEIATISSSNQFSENNDSSLFASSLSDRLGLDEEEEKALPEKSGTTTHDSVEADDLSFIPSSPESSSQLPSTSNDCVTNNPDDDSNDSNDNISEQRSNLPTSSDNVKTSPNDNTNGCLVFDTSSLACTNSFSGDDNANENNNVSSNPTTSTSATTNVVDPSSPSSSSSDEDEKQAQQQQYSSCGHSSIFGELQSVVFHNLIASLES